MDSKLSYNLLLGRPWLHDMDAVPSTIHGRLKFEYQGYVHTVIGNPEPYALCNATDLEEFTMTCPRYEIVPLEIGALVVNAKKIASNCRNRYGNIQNRKS